MQTANYEIGVQVVSHKLQPLGRLTAVEEEGSVLWGLLDEDYEIMLNGSELVLDVTGHARQFNESLEARFLRLDRGV